MAHAWISSTSKSEAGGLPGLYGETLPNKGVASEDWEHNSVDEVLTLGSSRFNIAQQVVGTGKHATVSALSGKGRRPKFNYSRQLEFDNNLGYVNICCKNKITKK